MPTPVEVEALTAVQPALHGIGFEVRAGEFLTLLGPKGAGKTTVLEIVAGLRQRGGGSVRVFGFDPEQRPDEVKQRLGIAPRAPHFQPNLKVREVLDLFAGFFQRHSDPKMLLQRWELEERREAFCGALSPLETQRLSLAVAIVNDPQVLLLDDPTAGLEPLAHEQLLQQLLDLHREHRSVLLATRNMADAEALSDRIALLDEGRLAAIGTPQQLQAGASGEIILEVRTHRRLPAGNLPWFQGASSRERAEGGFGLTVSSSSPSRTIPDLERWIDALDLGPAEIRKASAPLGNVFTRLTGKSLDE